MITFWQKPPHPAGMTDGLRSRSLFIFSNFQLACAMAFRVERRPGVRAAKERLPAGIGRIETDVAGASAAVRR